MDLESIFTFAVLLIGGPWLIWYLITVNKRHDTQIKELGSPNVTPKTILKLVSENNGIESLYIGEIDVLANTVSENKPLQKELEQVRSLAGGLMSIAEFPWLVLVYRDGTFKVTSSANGVNSQVKEILETAENRGIKVFNLLPPKDPKSDLKKRLILYTAPVWIFVVLFLGLVLLFLVRILI